MERVSCLKGVGRGCVLRARWRSRQTAWYCSRHYPEQGPSKSALGCGLMIGPLVLSLYRNTTFIVFHLLHSGHLSLTLGTGKVAVTTSVSPFCFQPRAGFPEIADVDQGEEFRLAGHRERHVRPEREDLVLVARVQVDGLSTREHERGQVDPS